MKDNLKLALSGVAAGICNGLFGSGGGMVVVPILERVGVSTHKAHATALAVILPLTVVSIWKYAAFCTVDIRQLAIVCAGGVLGGFLGAKLLRRFSDNWLSYIFGAFIIVAALRMVIS